MWSWREKWNTTYEHDFITDNEKEKGQEIGKEEERDIEDERDANREVSEPVSLTGNLFHVPLPFASFFLSTSTESSGMNRKQYRKQRKLLERQHDKNMLQEDEGEHRRWSVISVASKPQRKSCFIPFLSQVISEGIYLCNFCLSCYSSGNQINQLPVASASLPFTKTRKRQRRNSVVQNER